MALGATSALGLLASTPAEAALSLPAVTFTADNTTLQRQLAAKLGDVVSVKDFGAVGNGIANDSIAMQNAHLTGRIIYYPAGKYIFDKITIVTGGIIGDGSGQTHLLSHDRSTGDLITYTGTNVPDLGAVFTDNPVFENFFISAQYTKPDGAGINFKPAAGFELRYADVNRVSFINIPIGIHFTAASHWSVSSCRFINYSKAGLWVQNRFNVDSGDSAVWGSTFNTALGGAGIVQSSSGGLKVFGNKMLGGSAGYSLQFRSAEGSYGIDKQTGDLMIVGNSIEQMSDSGISLVRSRGTKTFRSITITGNQIGTTPTGIRIGTSGDPSEAIHKLSITGNVVNIVPLAAGSLPIEQTCISIHCGFEFTICGNTLTGLNLPGIPCTGIFIAPAASFGKIGVNSYQGFTTKVNKTTSAFTYVQGDTLRGGVPNVVMADALGPLWTGSRTVAFVAAFDSVPDVRCTVTGTATGGIAATAQNITRLGFTLSAVGATRNVLVPCSWEAEGVL